MSQKTCRIPPGTPTDSAGLVNREKCLFASWVSSVTQTPGGPAYTATCHTENHWGHTCKRKHLCQQVNNSHLHNTSQKAWKEKFYLASVNPPGFFAFFPFNIGSLSLLHLQIVWTAVSRKTWGLLPWNPCLHQAHLLCGLFDTLGNFVTFWRTCKRRQKVAFPLHLYYHLISR